MKKPDLNRIGVEGSLPRRLLEEVEASGLTLIDVRDLDHPSRVELVFNDGDHHLTTITYEDTEISPEPRCEGCNHPRVLHAFGAKCSTYGCPCRHWYGPD